MSADDSGKNACVWARVLVIPLGTARGGREDQRARGASFADQLSGWRGRHLGWRGSGAGVVEAVRQVVDAWAGLLEAET